MFSLTSFSCFSLKNFQAHAKRFNYIWHSFELPLIKKSYTFSGKIPARFNVGVMLFMACFTAYMLRTNISVNLIAMVQDTSNNNNTLPDVIK